MKFKSLLLLFVAAVAVSSCNDKGNTPEPETGDGQYLIMFYGSGCKGIDQGLLGNILQSVSKGSSDKVKMTFEYRFSDYYQKLDSKYTNVKRFTLDENADSKDKFNATDVTTMSMTTNLSYWAQYVKTHDFAGTDYIMASDTALTSFIKWSKSKYPKATKTILIINDHGGGWDLALDGSYDMNLARPMRNILSDDTQQRSPTYMSLGDVVKGIRNAGKVDVLYDDACLMSQWENLTGFSQVVSLFVGSQETTTGTGGNYWYLINQLENSTVTTDGMKKALESYVADVVEKWWPLTEKHFNVVYYNDLGVFDLRQISTPLGVISNISTTLNTKWDDETFKPAIHEAVTKCEIASNTCGDSLFALSSIPQAMQNYLKAQNIEPVTEKGVTGYRSKYVLRALKFTDMSSEDYTTNIEKYQALWKALASNTFDNYCLADFLRVLNNGLTEAGVSADNNPFKTLYAQYIQALQNFSYIRCTHELDAARAKELGMSLYAYNSCSPSVFLYPLSDPYYTQDDGWGMRYFKRESLSTAEKAVKCYGSTLFDKSTHWGTFLQKIDVIPNVILNPCREEIK